MVVRPPRLHPGATVAIISPSSGTAHRFPGIYQRGIRVLEDELGLRVKEFPTARASDAELGADPRRRANDINDAFRDPEVSAILATIGGDDSIRILPYLDSETIRTYPKILMGFSDTTTVLTAVRSAGVVAFHGPSLLAGVAQLPSHAPGAIDELRAVLFGGGDTHEYHPFPEWSEGYPTFSDPATLGRVSVRQRSEGWHWLAGEKAIEGELYGGCFEVLEFLKGTRYFPPPGFWPGKTLFLETSEEAPVPVLVGRALRNYGMIGTLDAISALWVGRPRGYSPSQKRELDDVILAIVQGEFGREDLPIVTNLDFGHTDPQWILPLGVRALTDPVHRRLALVEPAVS